MKSIRLFSIFLFVILIISSLPINAFCIETESAVDESTIELVSTSTTDTLDRDCVPEMILYENAIADGHVSREYSQEETLNSIVFKNFDDTSTLYLFDYNVKYIDENGETKDKSNVLVKSIDGSYQNEFNDIIVNYSSQASGGITLNYNGRMINIVAKNAISDQTSLEETVIGAEMVNPVENTSDAVEYDGVFGDETILRYTQTYDGYKEDIILESKPESNVFSFIVTTNGLIFRNNGGIITAYAEDEEYGSFGNVVVYDATYRNCIVGDAELTTIAEGKLYQIDLVVPQEFLDSDTTVYPVTIDPSLSVVTDSSNKIIEDATIYNNYNQNFGTWSSLFVGNFNAWYPTASEQRGIARTLMRFPGLFNNATFDNLYNAGRVTTVKLNFADIDCGSGPNTIKAYCMESTWEEDSVVYNSALWDDINTNVYGGSVTVNAQTVVVPYPRYNIDITLIVTNCMSNEDYKDYGIMLKSTDETAEAVVLGSSESGDSGVAGRADSKPYITVNYYSMPTTETYGITDGAIFQLINKKTGNALSYGSNMFLQAAPDASSLYQQFKLNYLSNGQYEIIPMFNTNYRVGANGSSLTLSAWNGLLDQRWHFNRRADGGFRIFSASNSYNLLITKSSLTSVYVANSTEGDLWDVKFLAHDVPLHEQELDSSCGPACELMALNYYGITNITEEQLRDYTTQDNYGFAYNVTNTLNYYLSSNGNTLEYHHKGIWKYASLDEYTAAIQNNISSGYPLLVQTVIPGNDGYFPYSSEGHYLLVIGIYYDDVNSRYMAVVNDPHRNCANRVHLPVSVLYNYNVNHGGFVIGVFEQEEQSEN